MSVKYVWNECRVYKFFSMYNLSKWVWYIGDWIHCLCSYLFTYLYTNHHSNTESICCPNVDTNIKTYLLSKYQPV